MEYLHIRSGGSTSDTFNCCNEQTGSFMPLQTRIDYAECSKVNFGLCFGDCWTLAIIAITYISNITYFATGIK